MKHSHAAMVLVGEKTKNLYKFVRWELDLAVDLDLPMIAANLSAKNRQDDERCPAIIRDTGRVVHIPFSLEAVKHALDNWPSEFGRLSKNERAGGARYYSKFH